MKKRILIALGVLVLAAGIGAGGWYYYTHHAGSAGENKTLICYVNYFELQEVKEIISRNKGSFSTVSTIDEILRSE